MIANPVQAIYKILVLFELCLAALTYLLAWRQSDNKASLPLRLLAISGALWILFNSLKHLSTVPEVQIWFAKLEYLGILGVPPLYLWFTLIHIHNADWLNWKRVALICLIPIVIFGVVLTNDLHHLVWSQFPETGIGDSQWSNVRGAGFWVAVTYSYLVLAISLLLLIRALRLNTVMNIKQSVILMVGIIFPLFFSIVETLGISPLPGIELPSLAFILGFLPLSWSMNRQQFIRLLPAARDSIIELMHDGFLVVDNQDRIVDINQRAREWMGLVKTSPLGWKLDTLQSEWPDLVQHYSTQDTDRFEHILKTAGGDITLELHIQPIRPNGQQDEQSTGSLVLIRDFSKQRKAEEQLKSHQKLLESIINASSTLIFAKALDGRYILGNLKWASRYHKEISEILGKKDLEILPPGTAINFRANDLAAIAAGEAIEVEEEEVTPEGKTTFIAVKFPLYNNEGQLYATAGISTDITDRKAAEERLRLQSFALEAAANGIVITDVNGSIQWVNPAFTRLTGYTLAEVIGQNPRVLRSGRNDPQIYNQLWKTILEGKIWHGEIVNRRKDGSEYIEEMTIAPVLDKDQIISHFIAIKQDITDRRQAMEALSQAHKQLQQQFDKIQVLQEKLREQAIRDALTGLFNRRYLEETLRRELARALREEIPVSVVMMDIDHFKRINDTYGHTAGDNMLRGLGEMLRTLIREGDVACRFGGEEFIAVLPGASLEVSAKRAEFFRREFELLSISQDDAKLCTTLSLGVAVFPDDATTADDLLKAADQALYKAKSGGRNQVCLFTRSKPELLV